MCTVTIVPLEDGYRLMCNRDEQHTRPAALPPRRLSIDGGQATMPIDPQGGGSWIAVTDGGLTIAMLNRMPLRAPAAPGALRSRGEIVTALASSRGLDQVAAALERIEPAAYRAFQLVAVAGQEVMAATSDGAEIDIATRELRQPVIFTSSSLGDASAERMRAPLFQAMVVHAEDPLAGQRAFHAHRWPRCGAFSVVMCRADARTVSRSTIDVRGGTSTFAYEPLGPDASCSPLPSR
jgi:hypothetical protein